MAGKSDACEAAILNLIFNNTAFANIGNAGGLQPSGVAGSLYYALHTADPGETGNQSTSEIAYTSYARAAVARGSFTVSGTAPTQVAPNANIVFPSGTGGSGTATYFSIGTLASGAGVILYSGQITTPAGGIICGNTITPTLTTATIATED